MYVLVYVDDILLTGNDYNLVQKTVFDLNTQFALKALGSLKYFLGFEVTRNKAGIHESGEICKRSTG